MLRIVIRGTIRHMLRVCAIFFLIVALLLVFMRAMTPKVNAELGHLGAWLSEELQLPLDIKNIRFAWSGGYLVVHFEGIDIFDRSMQRPFLHLKSAALRVRPIASLWARQFMFKELALSGLDIKLIQHADKRVTLSGLEITQALADRQNKIDWGALLLKFPVESIVIHKANVLLASEGRFYFPFHQVNIMLKDISDGFSIRSQATLLSGTHKSKVKFSGDIHFQNPEAMSPFYLSVSDIQAEALNKWIAPTEVPVLQDGLLNVKIWLDWQKGLVVRGLSQLDARDLLLPADGTDTFYIDRFKGQLRFLQTAPQNWKVWGENFEKSKQPNEMRFSIEHQLNESGQSRYFWVAKNLQWEDVNPFLQNSPLVPSAIRAPLKRYQPGGKLVYGSANHGDTLQQPSTFQLDLRDIHFKKTKSTPGLSGLDMVLSADSQSGSLLLSGDTVQLAYQAVSGPYIAQLKQFQGLSRWGIERSDWRLENQWGFHWEGQPIEALWKMHGQTDQPIELQAVVTAPILPAAPVGLAFPTAILEGDGANWLKSAIMSGTLLDTVMVFRGPLVAEPYENHQGIFQAFTTIEEGTLNFDEQWPNLEEIRAPLKFENFAFEATTEQASIGGAQIQSLVAQIPNFEKSVLSIDGVLDSTFDEAKNIIQNSPLSSDFKRLFDSTRLQGPIGLHLNLNIPLEGPDPLHLTGEINTESAQIQIPSLNIDFNQLNGRIRFTEKIVNATLQGSFLESPVALQVTGDFVGEEGKVQIMGQSHLTLPQIANWRKITLPAGVVWEGDLLANIELPIAIDKPTICTFNTSAPGPIRVALEILEDYPTKVQVHSKVLTGDFIWEPKLSPGIDSLKGKIQDLSLPDPLFSDSVSVESQALSQVHWPMVQLEIQKLNKGNMHLDHIDLRLSPMPEGYKIEQLNSQAGEMQLTSTGHWYFLADKKPMALKGFWDTKNIGNALQQFGFETNLKDARSHATFDLKWEGDLIDHLPSLEGSIAFEMKNGRILGINPGLGRVLSLFNIDNVKRRLQLDFSDLYKSGFSFDTLEGHAIAAQGQLKTEDLVIKGPVAQVQGKGNLSLSTKEIDAQLQVTPKVSGTLPMAAAIAAGNPAIGAAIWVFDKLIISRNSKASLQSYEYHITGNWSDPVVVDKEKNTFKLPGQKNN